MEVRVLEGDIGLVAADALITAINSAKLWFGGIDDVINRYAGTQFHHQAANRRVLTDGQTIIARQEHPQRGKFKNVVFVVDDLQRPLRDVVYQGLKAASHAGFKHITLPTIRMGVMLGKFERDRFEAIEEISKGVNLFKGETDQCQIETATFVVYNDPSTAVLLKKAFGLK